MADKRGNHGHHLTRYRDRHCVRQHNPYTRKGHDLYIDRFQFIRQRAAVGHSLCFDPGATTGAGKSRCICACTCAFIYTHSCSYSGTFSRTRSYTCAYTHTHTYTNP